MAQKSRQRGREGEAHAHRWRTALSVAAWLAIWQVAAWAVGSDLLLAGPVETVVALVGLVGESAFWAKIVWSFVRIAGGFLLAFVCALVLAYLSWRHTAVETFLRPALSAIKATPVVCIVVMLLIWFGSRWVSAVSVFLVVMPAVYFSALEGARSLDPERLDMLRLFGVPLSRQLGAYVWPQVQPFLLATSKMVVGMSWKAGVAAELIGTPVGSIGERIYQAKILLETAQVFAWTIVIVAIAYACERAFLWLLGRSATWSIDRAVDSAECSAAAKKQLASAVVNGTLAAEPHVAKRELAHPDTLSTDSQSNAFFDPCAIAVRHLAKRFGKRKLYINFDCNFTAGSRTCVMGPSGEGKTTLLRMIAGLEMPDGGVISFGSSSIAIGMPGANKVADAPRAGMAYQTTCLLEGLTAVENVMVADSLSKDAARRMLTEILPEPVLDKPVSTLSGGERRRVELVRAMAATSGVVLLDEPFASLDQEMHARCAAFVLAHQHGRTLIVATHDSHDAQLLDAQVVSLETGDTE